MKKILIPILLGLACAPVSAENLHKLIKNMGYTEDYIYKICPDTQSVNVFVPKLYEEIEVEQRPQATRLDPVDFLLPRVFQQSESVDMIPFLAKLQRKNPTSPKITRKLAITCLKNGQPREALYWFIQTYQRDRGDIESLWNMAAISYQLGKYDETEKYLKEYAEVDPNSAWGRMANDFLKGGRFSGETMNKGFKSEPSRFGYSDEGAGSKTATTTGKSLLKDGNSAGGGILIVDGKRTNVEKMVEEYQTSDVSKPLAMKDALKKDALTKDAPKKDTSK